MRKTDWLRVKRDPSGEVKVIPDGRKKMGCVTMSRGFCPRCAGRGREIAGEFIMHWDRRKSQKMGVRQELLRCPECDFEWVWDRQFKGSD